MSQKNNPTFFSRIKNLAKIVVGIPLTLISLFFIGSIILSNWNALLPHLFHLHIPLLLLGIGFLLVYFFIRALLWNFILKKMGHTVPLRSSLYLYTSSELRRYIPGNVFSFISRAALFKKQDVPVSVSAKALVLEAGTIVAGAAVMCIPSLVILYSSYHGSIQRYIAYHINTSLMIGIGVGVLILVGCICAAFFKLHKRIHISLYDAWNYKELVLLALLGWFFFGWGNYLLATTLFYLDPTKIMQYASLFVLSWAIGYLSIVTPMGLGVREAAVSEGLTLISRTTLGAASFISLFSRIGLIVAELLFFILSYIISRTERIEQVYSRFSTQTWILTVSTATYIGYFTYVTFQKHENFFTGRFDLGNMDQVVWNTLHGRIFMLTNPDSTNIISRLGIHADFMLILLAPFYLIWQDPRMLLLIQTVAIGLGALFVYLIARDVIQNKTISLLFALSYLLNPWIERQNLYDFHAVTLATPLLLGAYFFVEKKKYVWFGIFLLLAALTKENVFLIASFFGLYLIWKKRYFTGGILTVCGAIIFYLLIAKLIPDARGSAHFALEFFTDFGDSPASVLKSIFFNPALTFSKLVTKDNILYLHTLLAPTGYLSILSPITLLFSLPELGIYMLSANNNFRSMNFQYGAAIVPFVYISSIYGVKVLLSKTTIKPRVIMYYLGIITLVSVWIYGVLPGAAGPELAIFTKPVSNRTIILDFLATIPRQYSVAATNNLGAHLSHRERIYTIPNGIDQADIILFLLDDPYAQPSLTSQKQIVEKLRHDPRYTHVFEDGSFVVFAKARVHHLDIDF